MLLAALACLRCDARKSLFGRETAACIAEHKEQERPRLAMSRWQPDDAAAPRRQESMAGLSILFDHSDIQVLQSWQRGVVSQPLGDGVALADELYVDRVGLAEVVGERLFVADGFRFAT